MTDYAAIWQDEHEKHPGMAKATFVRNKLFGIAGDAAQLGHWAMTQDDLLGEVFESGCVSYGPDAMNETPNDDGTSTWRADPSKPHPEVGIRLEVVQRTPPVAPRHSCEEWCS